MGINILVKTEKDLLKAWEGYTDRVRTSLTRAGSDAIDRAATALRRKTGQSITSRLNIDRADVIGKGGKAPKPGKTSISKFNRGPDLAKYNATLTASDKPLTLNRFRRGHKNKVPSQKGRPVRRRTPIKVEVLRGQLKVRKREVFAATTRNGEIQLFRRTGQSNGSRGSLHIQRTRSLSSWMDKLSITPLVRAHAGRIAALTFAKRLKNAFPNRSSKPLR